MEFQFGTNWARFSKAAGGVIGQTLAMEGVFSFFLESSFLGGIPVRREAPGAQAHWVSAFLVLPARGSPGSSSSPPTPGCSIPPATASGGRGEILLSSLWGLLLIHGCSASNLHNMIGSVVTASFVMASVGAFYLLTRRHEESGRTFVRMGVIAGTVSTI